MTVYLSLRTKQLQSATIFKSTKLLIMNLKYKKAIITGGGSGIGLAIAQELSWQGVKVIISGRNKDKLDRAQSVNPKLHIQVCDVTRDEQIAALVDTMEADHGGIDILINNAGVFEKVDYRAKNQSIAQQEKEINIDFVGPIRMVHHFLPGLKLKAESAIVNVSSGLAFVPLALAPIYCATKAGLHSWTRSLRYQLQGSTVKVFELMPPWVDTEMVTEFKGQKMIAPEVVAGALAKGLRSNKLEITPGQSSQLKMMSRYAPGFIFKMLNKRFN